jgi:hypothetical protein
MDALHEFSRYLTQPRLRPWALLAPVLVLLVCLPLLRPLRHPHPQDISNSELARLATVQSLVENHTLAIEHSDFSPTGQTIHRAGHLFSAQPPTMAILLAGPYWLMHVFGLNFQQNPALVAYLLTLLGVTIPVAAGTGLVYRMGRMFELPRKKRALLAIVVAFGSGMISYAVVLNAQAPAAALVLGSAACFLHVAIARRPRTTSGWLAIAGAASALATAIDPAAIVFLVLFLFVIPMLRWRWKMKFAGILLYALGAFPPLLLHVSVTQPMTHRVISPIYFNPATIVAIRDPGAKTPPVVSPADDPDESVPSHPWLAMLWRNVERVGSALFGVHGIFSHFPVLILGVFGVSAVMHRHWPMTTKVLAIATVAGGLALLLAGCIFTSAGPGEMFGPQVFIVALPLLLLWSGAWLRRRHGPIKLALAGAVLLFSVGVTLIGATNPCPRMGYDRYTVAQALSNLLHPIAQTPGPLIAGR